MRKTILMIALICMWAGTVFSQDFEGYSKKLPSKQMVIPYGIEVTYQKTVHILFPTKIVYVDLGSDNIIAGKADGAENVLRVKASVKGFDNETNFSVICDDGSFYSFNARYVAEPEMLNIEIQDFINSSDSAEVPRLKTNVFLNDLANENPLLVKLVMSAIYDENSREIKHIGSQFFGIKFTVKGIYIHNDIFYIHSQAQNTTNVSFEVDFVKFKIVDKKVSKRTAIQETIIRPLRTYNEVTQIKGNETERTIFSIPKITIPAGKILLIELVEKNGARNQTLYIESSDLNNAKIIKNLKI